MYGVGIFVIFGSFFFSWSFFGLGKGIIFFLRGKIIVLVVLVIFLGLLNVWEYLERVRFKVRS